MSDFLEKKMKLGGCSASPASLEKRARTRKGSVHGVFAGEGGGAEAGRG